MPEMTEPARAIPDLTPSIQESLDAIRPFYGPPLIDRYLETAARFPAAKVNHALNRNQIASKRWLLDELHAAAGGAYRSVVVLGGWYGVVGAMLLQDRRFEIGRVVSVDLDPACVPIAESLNEPHVAAGAFRAIAHDATTLRYDGRMAAPDLIVNTSGEHFETTGSWRDQIPDGTLVAAQSNDFFDEPVHVNCMPNLEAWRADLAPADVLFAGCFPHHSYIRFMVIGRK